MYKSVSQSVMRAYIYSSVKVLYVFRLKSVCILRRTKYVNYSSYLRLSAESRRSQP